jgi:hypothetical protein
MSLTDALQILFWTAFGIFAANGQQLAVMPDREAAIAAAWENGLAPVTIH